MKTHVILLNKPVSVTPYQAIQKFREKHPEYNGVKLGFAGRLDPMAEGLLVVLVGDENKNRMKYENMSKHYTFSCLLGITSDTYDILGIPQSVTPYTFDEKTKQKLHDSITKLSKMTEQAFPPYSSKPVHGKPLYKWAREGKIDEIKLPTHPVTIESLSLTKTDSLSSRKLDTYIKKRVGSLIGDFRQETILEAWDNILLKNNDAKFTALDFSVSCSSGTYVRSLVHELGEMLGMGAVTLSITRKRVGEFHIQDAVNP